ncbi:proline-rich extensin-like protein EPR1 [Tachysurus fulvidraco]|uniref:proline-rich extensin-like protein EPR1 n=1 Tax=Tachysurus fulvidraco TaxID=1234273 RepID=UPI001FEF2E0A|nr:proline-rich extensin-like protein EPR1 [Tachysurus fulvidraco]
MSQPEETVLHVAYTPVFEDVPVNICPVYSPENTAMYNPMYYPVYNPEFNPEYTAMYYPVYNPEFNPVYYPKISPVYFQILPPEFCPQPPTVETVGEECFLPSPQHPQNHQQILPKRTGTLITNQDPNDGGQDVMINELLGGAAMFRPENVFPPENVSVPQHVSPPKTESPPETASSPETESPPETASPPEMASPPENMSHPEPVQTDTANTTSQPEETVLHVPVAYTPVFEDVPVNIRPVYSPEYNPVYNPVYYQILPPEFCPQPPTVETVGEQCFLPSPQHPQNHQQILPKRTGTLITNQDPNGGGRDVMINGPLGGAARYRPENVFPHKHKPTYDTPNTKGVELFIRGLDSIDEQRLYKEFRPFGNIIRIKLIKAKGYGYIKYFSEAEARTAIREMNGKIVGADRLNVTLNKTKTERAEEKMRRDWNRSKWQNHNKGSKLFWKWT